MTRTELKNKAIPKLNELWSADSARKSMARLLILSNKQYSSAELEKKFNVSYGAVTSYLHEIRKHFIIESEKVDGVLKYTIVDMTSEHSNRLNQILNSVFKPDGLVEVYH